MSSKDKVGVGTRRGAGMYYVETLVAIALCYKADESADESKK
jgi:hypothetical protein